MPRHLDRPTAKSIEATHTRLKGIWQGAHANWARWDTLYNLTFEVWDKEHRSRKAYRPSRARSIVNHSVDNLMSYFPRVHRDPVGEGDSHEDAAERLEESLKAILNNSALETPTLVYKKLAKHFILYGYSVIEGPLVNFADAPKKPEKQKIGESDDEFKGRERLFTAQRRNWNPIVIDAPHPTQVLLNPQEKRPKEAIKVSSHYARDLYDLSVTKDNGKLKDTHVFDMKGRDDDDMVDVVEYWNVAFHAVSVADGQLLYVEPNKGRFVPFAHAFAGFGIEPVSMTDYDPKHLAVGVLMPVEQTLMLQAQALSATHTITMRSAYAPQGTRLDAAEAAGQMAENKMLEGEKEDYWIMDTNDVPRAVFSMSEQYDDDIEISTSSRALGGRRQEGVVTVGQQAILSATTQRGFASVSVQVEHLTSITTSRILQLVDIVPRLKDGIGVNGSHLRRADIYSSYHAAVTFEVLDPVLDLQRRQLGLTEVQAGIQSTRDYLEHDKRVESVRKYMKNLDKQRVRETPGVWELRGGLVADEIRLGDEFAAAMQPEEPQSEELGIVPRPANGTRPIGAQPEVTSEGMAADAELRQPLTPQVAKPGRLG
jgi:hypothetical protein